MDDFFKLEELKEHDGTITGMIGFNRSHRIFEGHFPGVPVVPGVCMMQMVKEILEFRLKRKFLIRTADQVKFLAVINPDQVNRVHTEIHFRNIPSQETEIAARLYFGNVTFFKLKARLTEV